LEEGEVGVGGRGGGGGGERVHVFVEAFLFFAFFVGIKVKGVHWSANHSKFIITISYAVLLILPPPTAGRTSYCCPGANLRPFFNRHCMHIFIGCFVLNISIKAKISLAIAK
jgi:hypothetical protein